MKYKMTVNGQLHTLFYHWYHWTGGWSGSKTSMYAGKDKNVSHSGTMTKAVTGLPYFKWTDKEAKDFKPETWPEKLVNLRVRLYKHILQRMKQFLWV